MTRTAWLSVAALLAGGCLSGTMPVARTPAHAWPAGVRAGVAVIDITPPPGLSLFGHAPESRVATGTQTRLECHAFVITSGDGQESHQGAVALVPCELPMPSLLLQRKVAVKLADAAVPLGANRLMLMATHTHAGPGHYFASGNLSGPFSSRLYGFDMEVLDFLAERIAEGIVRAYDRLATARVGWGYATVRGLTRNRNLVSFRENNALPRVLREASADPWLAGRYSPAELAVDPLMSLLRIDRDVGAGPGGERRYEPLGVLAVFGIHATAIENNQELYNGDLLGYGRRMVAEHIDAEVRAQRVLAGQPAGASDVVVAFANGIEGDIMPNRDYLGPREARRLGRAVGSRALDIWQRLGMTPTALTTDARVRVAYRELRFDSARLEDGRVMCDNAQIGAAAAGGGFDHPTRVRLVTQFNEGVHRTLPLVEGECLWQFPKLPMQNPFGPSTVGQAFPNYGPIALVQVGNGLLATLPAEVTTVTGLRVREALETIVREAPEAARPERVTVAGLTNEYLQYVATEDEYQLQRYEGASTLYGALTAQFLREQHECLGRWMLLGEQDCACRRGQLRADDVHPIPWRVFPVMERMPERPDALAPEGELDPARRFETRDGRFGYVVRWRGPPAGSTRLVPRWGVRVERVVAPGSHVVAADDTGDSIEVHHLLDATDEGVTNWSAVWTPWYASNDWRCGEDYRFVVDGLERRVTVPFTLSCCPPHGACAP